MSVIKEFILFAAGIVITVSLAVIGFNIYSKAAEMGRQITENEQYALKELKEYEVMRFDGSEVDGSRVISYIKKIYATRDIPIEVTNDAGSFVVDNASIEEIRNTASSYYLNPLKKYTVTVLSDANDEVAKIKIEIRR